MVSSIYEVCWGDDKKVSAVKKGSKYTILSVGDIVFKDTLSFSAPCSLSKYLKQWGVSETKSVWPYSLFSSIEEIESTTVFPRHSDFYSVLKQCNVTEEEYLQARGLYNYHHALSPSDPNHWPNMKAFLCFYNMLDVRPLVQAIVNSFKAFQTHFNVIPLMNCSLPSLAFQAMFNLYDKNLPFSASFQNEESRKLFRDNILGGLTTVTHRHVNLEDERGPPNAHFAQSGDRFTSVSFWDFNAMYLWSQKQDMPLTPGLKWTRRDGYFKKETLMKGVSLTQLQWLYYLQSTDVCVDSNGTRHQIQHAYHRGEHKVGGFFIDGYLKIDDREIFFEFNGEFTLMNNITMVRLLLSSWLLHPKRSNSGMANKT